MATVTEYLKGVYRLRRGQGPAAAPVVCDSPHSGRVYPAQFRTGLPRAMLRRYEDGYVDDLFADVPDVGAALLSARFPRTFIDVNRARGDLDLDLIDGAWPEPVSPGDNSRRGHGLIWSRLGPNLPLYDRPLPVAEVRARIANYWCPYHAALKGEMDRLHGVFGTLYHLNCHSMPGAGSPLLYRGSTRRADMVLGDRDGNSCAPAFSHFVRSRLEGMGYSVRMNRPYRGAELVRAYGQPAAGRHSLQIEINRALYLDETNVTKLPGFAALADDMTRLVRDVVDYALSDAGKLAAE